jgi:hypothetical protein
MLMTRKLLANGEIILAISRSSAEIGPFSGCSPGGGMIAVHPPGPL